MRTAPLIRAFLFAVSGNLAGLNDPCLWSAGRYHLVSSSFEG